MRKIRCNLAFFPNVTHKCRAGHASTFTTRPTFRAEEDKHSRSHALFTQHSLPVSLTKGDGSICFSAKLHTGYIDLDGHACPVGQIYKTEITPNRLYYSLSFGLTSISFSGIMPWIETSIVKQQ